MASFPKYAPEFRLRINDEPLPLALRAAVTSVSYQDGLEGADRVEVTFANPGLRWLNHPLLQVDNGLTLSIGYAPRPIEEVFVGEITGVAPSFPNGAMPTIGVTAQDFLQRLTQGKGDRAFRINFPGMNNLPLPDVVVASMVSESNRLIRNLDPVGGALSVLMTLGTYLTAPDKSQSAIRRQESESDFGLLSTIARESGWEVFIDHTLEPHGHVLRFKFLMLDITPNITLRWGASLMEFTPRLTTIGDVFGVTARVWIDSLRTEFVIVVNWDFERAAFNLQIHPNLIGDIDDVLPPEGKGKTLSIKPTGFPTALREILTELLPRLNNRLTGSGSTIGDPRIKAGEIINLEGLGDQFSGLYRITSATHTLDSGGYRTSFEARREVWFPFHASRAVTSAARAGLRI
jgi:uncharacterized protein